MLEFVERITPDPLIMQELPFYYTSLFSGQSGTGDDFWVGMSAQVESCGRAVARFKSGFSGCLIITGLRSSGKSSLSKRVAETHFGKEKVHVLRAPQACSADTELFSRKLLESLGAQNQVLEDVFMAMPPGKVVVIQDLGLWWEHRPGGDAVVRLIQTLVDRFGGKCLFIINVNSLALDMLHMITDLRAYALDVVSCEPFDARELRDLILLRHQAGGMRLTYNKKSEDRMTAWDFASLFNDVFNHSFGNPGMANILWLSSIYKVSGKTLYMRPVSLSGSDVFNDLNPEQWFVLHQLIVHRRFAPDQLANNLEVTQAAVQEILRGLMRSGVVVEKFEGVYAVRPGLDLFLIEKLKNRERI